jgi:hypothetical protein
MKVYVTRDSAAAGDDVDAPHGRTLSFPDAMPIEQVIDAIARSGYLARRSDLVSGLRVSIAVVAQQSDIVLEVLKRVHLCQ